MTISVPDESQCRAFMERYDMWPNIVEHSYRVCQLSLFLCSELNREGAGLDLELVRASSLLHDITKAESLRTGENHAETGRGLLTALGYPEVAEIVGSHIRLEEGASGHPLSNAHLVNYADKRVRHTTVVSLQERFADLEVRYGVSPASRGRIDRLKAEMFHMERRIFRGLPFEPVALTAFNDMPVFDLVEIPSSLAPGR